MLIGDFLFHGHQVHDGVKPVALEIGNLFGPGVLKKPGNFGRSGDEGAGHSGHHVGIDLAFHQHLFDVAAQRRPFYGNAGRWLERYGFAGTGYPVNLVQWNAVFVLQVPLGQHRQGGLETAQAHPLADKVLRPVDTGGGVYVHLRLAEQAARKHRDGGEGSAPGDRHDVGGQGKLGAVPLQPVQHPLVPARFHGDVPHIKLDTLGGHRPVQQGKVAVVVFHRQSQPGFGHRTSPQGP